LDIRVFKKTLILYRYELNSGYERNTEDRE
jgi:hypothetical protein